MLVKINIFLPYLYVLVQMRLIRMMVEPMNEGIASIFYYRGWVESWGTGTVRMIKYCKENGADDILTQLDAPIKPRTLRDDLSRLNSLGLIELESHGKSAKWYIVKDK